MRHIISLILLFSTISCDVIPNWEDAISVGDFPNRLAVYSILTPDSTLTAFLDVSISLDENFGNTSIIQELEKTEFILFKNDSAIDTLTPVLRDDKSTFRYLDIGVQRKLFFNGSTPLSYLPSDVYRIALNSETFGSVQATTHFPDDFNADNVVFQPNIKTLREYDVFFFLEHGLTATIETNDQDGYFAVVVVEIKWNRMLTYTQFGVNIPRQKEFINTPLEPTESSYEKAIDDFWPYTFVAFPASSLLNEENNLQVRFLGAEFSEAAANDINSAVPDLLYVFSITKDYYEYLSTANAQMNSQNLPFSEPIPITSNIEGGFGVFGAIKPVLQYPITPIGASVLDGTYVY